MVYLYLPTGEVMKTIDDEGYKYLGILELDEIMEERAYEGQVYKRVLSEADIGFEIKAKRKEQIPSYKYLGGGTIKKWSRCYDLEEA